MNKIKWVLLFGVPFVLMLTFLPLMDFYKKTYIIDGFFLIMRTLCLVLPEPHGDQDWFYGMFLGFFSLYLGMLILVLSVYFLVKYIPVVYCLLRNFIKNE